MRKAKRTKYLSPHQLRACFSRLLSLPSTSEQRWCLWAGAGLRGSRTSIVRSEKRPFGIQILFDAPLLFHQDVLSLTSCDRKCEDRKRGWAAQSLSLASGPVPVLGRGHGGWLGEGHPETPSSRGCTQTHGDMFLLWINGSQPAALLSDSRGFVVFSFCEGKV